MKYYSNSHFQTKIYIDSPKDSGKIVICY